MDVKVDSNGLDDQFSTAVAEFQAGRAVIEQAKGMLMFLYGVDADGAFDMLRQQSQRHNVKLRLVAEQIAIDLLQTARSAAAPRPEEDPRWATARQRVADAAARTSGRLADTA